MEVWLGVAGGAFVEQAIRFLTAGTVPVVDPQVNPHISTFGVVLLLGSALVFVLAGWSVVHPSSLLDLAQDEPAPAHHGVASSRATTLDLKPGERA